VAAFDNCDIFSKIHNVENSNVLIANANYIYLNEVSFLEICNNK